MFAGYRHCKKCGKALMGLFDGALCDECEEEESRRMKDYKHIERMRILNDSLIWERMKRLTVIYPTIVCEDAVSRILARMWNCRGKHTTSIDKVKMEQIIRDELPSVTRQTGHWIIIDDCEKFIAKCSECGRIEDSRMISKYPYCHCGARMVEPQESEEV